MFKKKAQAALEFLTTYGWAFLVILVMIGALSYFGVLSPDNYVPDSCNFGSVMSCYGGYAISYDGANTTIKVDVSNIMPNSIKITSIKIKEKTASNYSTDLLDDATWSDSGDLKTDSLAAQVSDTITIDTTEDIGASDYLNQKKTFLFDLMYTVGTSNISKLLKGSITTTVIDNS